MSHPECRNGCAYARDIGMAPQYSCAGGCQYAKASLAALRRSKVIKDAQHRHTVREIGKENVAELMRKRGVDNSEDLD